MAGEGFRGLQVADRVGHRSRKVRLIISEWQTEGPSPAILSLILEAARERGVSVAGGPITGAAGSGALEAVVTASEVIPCAVLAIVPRRVPRVISMDARLGRLGGLSVDRCMKTSASGVFAVGGCAELDPGYVPSALLEGDASVSGRIGGANCMGEGHAISLERFNEFTAFGLRWTRAGVGFGGARSSGIEVGVATGRTGGSSACQILYEKRSKRVVGVETVAPTDTISQGVVPLSTGVSLQTLAYGGLGSSDISLISDTARLGLREWQKS